jgi:hypothetical protein
LLWAAIGRKLAEKEPEFSRGPGRKKGGKNQTPLINTPEEIARRRSRAKLARQERTIKIGDETLELEPGVSIDPPWKR